MDNPEPDRASGDDDFSPIGEVVDQIQRQEMFDRVRDKITARDADPEYQRRKAERRAEERRRIQAERLDRFVALDWPAAMVEEADWNLVTETEREFLRMIIDDCCKMPAIWTWHGAGGVGKTRAATCFCRELALSRGIFYRYATMRQVWDDLANHRLDDRFRRGHLFLDEFPGRRDQPPPWLQDAFENFVRDRRDGGHATLFTTNARDFAALAGLLGTPALDVLWQPNGREKPLFWSTEISQRTGQPGWWRDF